MIFRRARSRPAGCRELSASRSAWLPSRATFYFDLGSPYAYLAAERICRCAARSPSRGSRCRWARCSSWPGARRGRWGIPTAAGRGWPRCSAAPRLYGLATVRWPEPVAEQLPVRDARLPRYAFQVGRGQEFTLGAFRAAFRQGHDLGVPEHVLQVAGEVGLDPREVRAMRPATPRSRRALRAATEAAHELRCLRRADRRRRRGAVLGRRSPRASRARAWLSEAASGYDLYLCRCSDAGGDGLSLSVVRQTFCGFRRTANNSSIRLLRRPWWTRRLRRFPVVGSSCIQIGSEFWSSWAESSI